MTEAQLKLLRELAEVARDLADRLRPIEEVHGEEWCNAEYLADELSALDWELACGSLRVA